MAEEAATVSTRLSVVISLAVAGAEALALGTVAWLSSSAALATQTADNTADVAVEVFLLIGVLSSARPVDDSHPLGYGRERFFWSLLAALGIFVGGGLGLEDAVQSALHPSTVHDYLLAYIVLAATVAMDSFALIVTLRPLQKQAKKRHISLREHFRRSTDPASNTVGAGGRCGGCRWLCGCGRPGAEPGGGQPGPRRRFQRRNRCFAPGRVGPTVAYQPRAADRTWAPTASSGRDAPCDRLSKGVLEVPDLFGVIVGPRSVIVDGDVIFADDMDVPAVEATITAAALALRERWPSIEYLYLTPVPKARPRRAVRTSSRSGHRAVVPSKEIDRTTGPQPASSKGPGRPSSGTYHA